MILSSENYLSSLISVIFLLIALYFIKMHIRVNIQCQSKLRCMKYKSLFEQAENGNHYSTINAKLVKSGCKTPVIKFTLQYPNIF